MRVFSLALSMTLLLSLLPPIAGASEDSGSTWRTRVSSADRDAYSKSDITEELVFGREIAARLLGRFKMSTNNRQQRYVSSVGTLLAQNCSRPELDFHFAVIESSEANAYSTPGGYVFVTTALMRHMENEAELAAVLAHEIGHVTERHIVKELSLRGAEESSVSALTALIGGASKSAGIAFSQAVDKAVELLLRDGYKKDDEIQADISAVLLCAFSGYDPAGLVTLLDKVGAVKSGIGKTYPAYDVRRVTIQKTMTDEGVDGSRLALNTERFAVSMKAEKSVIPFDMIRNVIPGGKHD